MQSAEPSVQGGGGVLQSEEPSGHIVGGGGGGVLQSEDPSGHAGGGVPGSGVGEPLFPPSSPLLPPPLSPLLPPVLPPPPSSPLPHYTML